jgi:hypothetical protein
MNRFLFPSDYFNPKKVDEAYIEQVDCLRNMGFETSVISLEALASGASKIFPVPESGENLIYRGWMLTSADYSLFVNAVINTGAEVLTVSHSPHHLIKKFQRLSKNVPNGLTANSFQWT